MSSGKSAELASAIYHDGDFTAIPVLLDLLEERRDWRHPTLYRLFGRLIHDAADFVADVTHMHTAMEFDLLASGRSRNRLGKRRARIMDDFSCAFARLFWPELYGVRDGLEAIKECINFKDEADEFMEFTTDELGGEDG